MRLEDRGAREQEAHVRGGRDLAGVRARSVDRRMEARERALQGLERHRTGDVADPGETAGTDEPECRHRRHELRPVDQREALFRLKPHRGQPGPRQGLGARQPLLPDPRLPLADERQRQVGERGEVTARSDRAAGGHKGDDSAVQHRQQQLHRLDAGSGVALGNCVRAKQHRGADDLVRVRLTDSTGMAAEETELQVLGLIVGDRLRHEPAEPGVDAVGVLATQLVQQAARASHLLHGARSETDVAAADRDVPDVLDREVVARQQEQIGHGARV